jgi:hypothetical protein
MASAHPRGQVTPIPVASAGLTVGGSYTSGDVLGGQMQFRIGDGFGAAYGEITQVVVIDKAAVLGACELWLFSSAVTPASDNAALSFSDTDMQSLVAILPCSTVYTTALNKVVVCDPAEGRPVFSGQNGILYGTLVTRTGNTGFGAVGDVTVVLFYEAEC